MSDSVWPHRRQPTRLRRPWDPPGKNTGVGCHFLLQCMKEKSESEVAQSCPTLSDPMDCSLPGSPVHGFSRQEYWSGVPLPYTLQNQHVCVTRFIVIFDLRQRSGDEPQMSLRCLGWLFLPAVLLGCGRWCGLSRSHLVQTQGQDKQTQAWRAGPPCRGRGWAQAPHYRQRASVSRTGDAAG